MPRELDAEELEKAGHKKRKKGPPVAVFAGSGVADGKANDAKVATWTYQWGFITEPVLKRILNVTYSVSARYCISEKKDKKTGEIKYAGKGVLQKVATRPGLCTPYVLTGHGLNIARKNWTGENLGYPWPKSRLPMQQLNHDEMSQILALSLIGDGGELQAEREYKDGKPGALPDFIISRPGGVIEWHETEINGKDEPDKIKLTFQIQERVEAFRRGEFTKLIWHFDKEGDRKAMIKQMANDSLPYISRENHKYSQDINTKGLNPSDLAAVSEYKLIDQELSIFDKKLEEIRDKRNAAALAKFEAMHL